MAATVMISVACLNAATKLHATMLTSEEGQAGFLNFWSNFFSQFKESSALPCPFSTRLLSGESLTGSPRTSTSSTSPSQCTSGESSTNSLSYLVNHKLNLNFRLPLILCCLGTIFIVCYANPWFILIMLPLLVAYYFLQKFYVATARYGHSRIIFEDFRTDPPASVSGR